MALYVKFFNDANDEPGQIFLKFKVRIYYRIEGFWAHFPMYRSVGTIRHH